MEPHPQEVEEGEEVREKVSKEDPESLSVSDARLERELFFLLFMLVHGVRGRVRDHQESGGPYVHHQMSEERQIELFIHPAVADH